MRAIASDLPIRFDNVSVTAGAVTLLDRITLQIEAGAPTVIIGPNGSGKTTLLRTAMGLLPSSQGCVTWGGVESASPLRRAFMFQRPVMLRRSAAANLSYALRAASIWSGAGANNERQARVRQLLGLVGLDQLGKRPARRLSGGEQQRLALARALARDPVVLFLDEPTASLDPAATKAIEDIIAAVATSGIKVVMATHDLGEARRLAGDIILLHRGQMIERGDAGDFFASPKTAEARSFLGGELLV